MDPEIIPAPPRPHCWSKQLQEVEGPQRQANLRYAITLTI